MNPDYQINLGSISIEAVEYAIQGNAMLGIRESGKSYDSTYIAEQLMQAQIPFIAFDPIGIWKYLRVPGIGPGLPVVVAGGKDGDLPLTPETAPDIVRAAMREGISLVIDLYDVRITKAQWRRIVGSSVELLMYENGEHGLRHVFIEEAAEFIPQKIRSEQGMVYSQLEALARMGGNAQLGYTLINQRAEEVNKAILELCAAVFLHRQTGRNSITALEKWFKLLDVESMKQVITSMPLLKPGECYVMSTGSSNPVLTTIPQKQTFHPNRRDITRGTSKYSGAVDVKAFVAQLAESLAKAKKEPMQVPVPKKVAAQQIALPSAEQDYLALSLKYEAKADWLSPAESDKRIQAAVEKAVLQERAVWHMRVNSAIADLRGDEMPVGERLNQAIEDTSRVLNTQAVYAPAKAIQRLAQRVEENSRLSGGAKNIVRTLVDEYPDLPDGIKVIKLAQILHLKPQSGRFYANLKDLAERHMITLTGSGNDRIAAINTEAL